MASDFTVSNDSVRKASALRSSVVEDIEQTLQENQVNAVVYDQQVIEEDEVRSLADTYGISYGKAYFLKELIDQNQNLTKDDMKRLSTMNMEMEAFYAKAKDADYIIYNSTIDGELTTMDEFLAKSPLLADFKAVKEGHVWCTGKNLFQETMGLGNMIQDIHRMLTEETPDEGQMHYIHQLK